MTWQQSRALHVSLCQNKVISRDYQVRMMVGWFVSQMVLLKKKKRKSISVVRIVIFYHIRLQLF